MAFRNKGMTFKSMTAKQFGAKISVTDVMVISEAVDWRSICKENSYIMKHGGLFQEFRVKPQFRMGGGYCQSLVRHKTAVHRQEFPERCIVAVIFGV